jgi:hypothetical protein
MRLNRIEPTLMDIRARALKQMYHIYIVLSMEVQCCHCLFLQVLVIIHALASGNNKGAIEHNI